jgi:hypothetical protein
VSTGTEDHDDDHSAAMGKSIARGIAIGIPVTYVVMLLGFWLVLDRDFGRALETAALPALLTGSFFGGFAGISASELARGRAEKAARSRGRNG